MAKVPVIAAEFSPSVGNFPVAVAIGYSARALAQALTYSGFRVVTVDAFGDCDTIENSLLVQMLPDWGSPNAEFLIQPHHWFDQIGIDFGGHRTLAIPVLFGGGVESWVNLQHHLCQNPLLYIWGASPKQFSQLRSLNLWRKAADSAGMRFPKTLTAAEVAIAQQLGSPILGIGRWLSKSLESAGGLSVARTTVSSRAESVLPVGSDHSRPPKGRYFQEEITGRILGATFVAEWESASASQSSSSVVSQPHGAHHPAVRYLGATESWQADDWFGPTEFIYRGSWGPIELTEHQQSQLNNAARFLVSETGIRGWLQIDFIEDLAGQLWFLEVNPRWSAGMEVLLRSGLVNPVAAHAKSWGVQTVDCFGLPQSNRAEGTMVDQTNLLAINGSNSRIAGKAVVYCQRDILAEAEFIAKLQRLPREQFADIPSNECIGQIFKAGQPLLTVLERIEAQGCDTNLRQRILTRLRALVGQLANLFPLAFNENAP